MKITTSNILLGVAPAITTGVSTDQPLNITDPDFSTLYRSSNNNFLTMDFGITSSINYVAVAGINIKGNANGTSYIRVENGNTLVKQLNIYDNQIAVIHFDAQSFSNLRVVMSDPTGSRPIVRFVAAGLSFEVPNDGETAGYNRQWLARHYKNKTTLNSEGAPVAVLREKSSATMSLNLPNMTKAFSENEWQDFLGFSQTNYFFVTELNNLELSTNIVENKSSYLCYGVTENSVKAHPQTRELNNISIKAKVFNSL